MLEVCFLPSEETEDLGSAFAEDLASAFTELDSFEAASVFCSVSEFVAFPTSSNFSVSSCFPPFPRAFVARTQIYNQTQIHQNSSVPLDIIV